MQTIANHSEQLNFFKHEPLKLDLQFFAAEEDAILPDDFSDTSTEDIQEDGVDTDETELEDIEQPEEQSQDEQPSEQEEQPKFKIKYNKEEQEISYDDAVPLIQKGMNYEKLQEQLNELKTDPRLAFIDELAQESGMSAQEFIEMARQQREQQMLDELIQQNIPEEYAREMIENRKFRQQIQQEREAAQQKEQETKDYNEFFEYFSQVNGRLFDPNKDTIPQEVLEAKAQGVPLKYAYMEHQNKELQAKVQRLTQNQTNKQKAPVTGTTAHGSQEVASEDVFLQGFNSI